MGNNRIRYGLHFRPWIRDIECSPYECREGCGFVFRKDMRRDLVEAINRTNTWISIGYNT